ncbi:MAG: DUF1801 domain-containing protein [Aquabacterium sp.]
MSTVAQQVAGFIGKYTPEIEATIQACRETVQGLFPRGVELVYDNYNALVFAYAPSEQASEAVLSLAAYPRWVTLFFAQGAHLSDPAGLLEGEGVLIRGIPHITPEKLRSAPVRALIAQAMAPAQAALAQAPLLKTVVKSVSAKQRARRPAA